VVNFSIPAGGLVVADEEVVSLLDCLLLEQALNRATGTTSKAAALTVIDLDMASGVPGVAVVKPYRDQFGGHHLTTNLACPAERRRRAALGCRPDIAGR
jgi:hypothetical protein